jgi:hypothetical protein
MDGNEQTVSALLPGILVRGREIYLAHPVPELLEL